MEREIMENTLHKLENEHIKAAITPDDGGRLVELTDKSNNRNFIWTNKRTKIFKRYYGANYDNLSAGGVEEAFPSVFPEQIDDNDFPFFGEIWSAPWKADNANRESVTLSCYSSIYPVAVQKTWSIEGQKCICRYKLINEGYLPILSLFGVHPSFAVMPEDKLIMPDGRYILGVVKPEQCGLNVNDAFDWPAVSGRDLSNFRPNIETMECIQFHTANMVDGSIRLIGKDEHSLHLTFDHKFFTSTCVWQIFGGWRGHYTVMLEFFTGWPLKLSEAISASNCLTIAPMQSVETQVTYKIYNK